MANNEILYDNDNVRIIYDPNRELHFLVINGHLTSFENNVLEELAETSEEGLRTKINTINPDLDYIMKEENFSYSTLAWVLAQARISELKRELVDMYNSRVELEKKLSSVMLPHALPKVIPMPK